MVMRKDVMMNSVPTTWVSSRPEQLEPKQMPVEPDTASAGNRCLRRVRETRKFQKMKQSGNVKRRRN
jgi:hypothetical protein